MFGIPFLSSLNASSWDQIFQNHESQMKQKYRMHNLYVEVSKLIDDRTMKLPVFQSRVPKDRLLIWNPNDGWGPICDFLEKERPSKEFPWLNQSKKEEVWEKHEWWISTQRHKNIIFTLSILFLSLFLVQNIL